MLGMALTGSESVYPFTGGQEPEHYVSVGSRVGAQPRDDDVSRGPQEAAVTESIKLGIPGLSVPQGTHLCGFFRGREERGDIVFPFVREALRCGDKCLCAYEATDPAALHAEVSAEVEVTPAGDQLDLVPARDIYLGRGEFSVANMLNYWDSWAATSLAGGEFSFARASAR
jgi:MEDS: MEthanogen/methylotroph, DcmR Sensory domain